MLRFVPCPQLGRLTSKPSFAGWGLTRPTVSLLAQDPNAFLFGAIFDRMVVATKAWESPRLLRDRLGHLDVRRLAKMSVPKLSEYIGRRNGVPAIHRFKNIMAESIVDGARRLLDQYGGDASRIWRNDPGVPTVLTRLQEFRGISQKIGNMTIRLLITYYGVRLSGWEAVDVAVDRHVARVFLRTGLVGTPGQKSYAVSELRERIVSRARELLPAYPGGLDEPAFVVGREWCTASEAYCESGEEPCPLRSACPRSRRNWQIQ